MSSLKRRRAMGLFDIFRRKKEDLSKLEEIGVVTHYFPKVKAAVIKLNKGAVKAGDDIYIKGHTSAFKQKIKSLQINHVPVEEGKKGQEIGIKISSRVRTGDVVYKF